MKENGFTSAFRQRLPAAPDIAPTVMLLLASRASALSMLPFGIAFFAAVYDKRIFYIGIITVILGTLTAAGAAAVPKYLIAVILYMLLARIYRRENEYVLASLSGISVLIGGAVTLLAHINGLYDLFLLICESVITSLMYIVFGRAKAISESFPRRGRRSAEDFVSAAVAAGVFISGLGDIHIGPVSIAGTAAVYVILVCAMNCPIAVSASAGLAIGFMTSMSGSASLPMMGVFGMMSFFAGFLNSYGRWGCALGGLSGAAAALIYAHNMFDLPVSIFDVAAGTALFSATPPVVMAYYSAFFNKSVQIEAVSPELRMREYLSMRLKRTGEAFGSLYESFLSVSEGRLKKYSDDIGTILDETAERVCGDCRMRGKCWQSDFRRTYKNMLELIGMIETGGGLTRENIPAHFCERCVRTDRFINEINHIYELYKREQLRRSDALITRSLISTQYNELQHLFDGMADEIDGGFRFMESDEERIVDELDKLGISPYEVSAVEADDGSCEVYLRLAPAVNHTVVEGAVSKALGRSVELEKTTGGLSKYVSRPVYSFDSAVLQLTQAGSRANGDSLTMFSDGRGKFYAISADGMGSGSEAQYESAAALRLLTSFLKAGFAPRTAIGILNSSMCLNMDNEMYSTLDLLAVDMFTGAAELYKIGSAETVMYNGGEARAIASASVPAGIIGEIRPEKKKLELREGDVILMMTDGITEAGYAVSKTDWIKSIIIKPHDSMEQLAREVMDTALRKSRGVPKDDMSIIALRLLSV